MTILTAFLVNALAVTIGTFLGNLGLLLLIGKKAEAVEKQRIAQAKAAQEKFAEALKREQEKMREYVKMES